MRSFAVGGIITIFAQKIYILLLLGKKKEKKTLNNCNRIYDRNNYCNMTLHRVMADLNHSPYLQF